jgi:hypothetical protein
VVKLTPIFISPHPLASRRCVIRGAGRVFNTQQNPSAIGGTIMDRHDVGIKQCIPARSNHYIFMWNECTLDLGLLQKPLNSGRWRCAPLAICRTLYRKDQPRSVYESRILWVVRKVLTCVESVIELHFDNDSGGGIYLMIHASSWNAFSPSCETSTFLHGPLPHTALYWLIGEGTLQAITTLAFSHPSWFSLTDTPFGGMW